jgi:hypothetical protein
MMVSDLFSKHFLKYFELRWLTTREGKKTEKARERQRI